MRIRQARADDYDAVAAFTRETWADREITDYLPDVYHDWVDGDGERQRTLVADVRDDADTPPEPGDIAGILKTQLLSSWESWASGMRIHPDFRDRGLSRTLSEAGFEWARSNGAAVCRNMTFSWNGPALGSSRRVGFEPCTEIRWAHPTPDAESASALVDDEPHPDGAWAFWSDSAARESLGGLVMDDAESWALSTLTRERLHAAAADGRLHTVEGGRRGFTERVRTFEREGEGDDGASETVTYAEYAVGAWLSGDDAGAEAVLSAAARDAARVGADRTRVMIPEGVSWASDAALARATIADEPAFVLSARL